MTKLMEWLLFGGIIFSIWISTIAGAHNFSFTKTHEKHIFFMPVYAVIVFGIFSALLVLYRALSIKDCKEAAIELQQQIDECKKDLQSKGIIFKGSNKLSVKD